LRALRRLDPPTKVSQNFELVRKKSNFIGF
jgi:hypothetical protein